MHIKVFSSLPIFSFNFCLRTENDVFWGDFNFADSFISIKFEDNGVASWEKSTVSNKVSLENCNNKMSWNHHQNNKGTTTTIKSVIEHGKSRDAFRWRKRIGHMFQLIRWKKGTCHVSSNTSKVEGVKVRKGWMMRTLTKRKKTME